MASDQVSIRPRGRDDATILQPTTEVSTAPAWGATALSKLHANSQAIRAPASGVSTDAVGKVHGLFQSALAWGATSSRGYAAYYTFQSARPWARHVPPEAAKSISFNPRARVGRDGRRPCRRRRRSRFNPRARVGRDLRGADTPQTTEVSIRAPAWGATRPLSCSSGRLLFQSARPRGARPQRILGNQTRQGFNPRARVGRDDARVKAVTSVFQSAARVGRDARRTAEDRGDGFQSARPRGARPATRALTANNRFQSARPRGARHAGASPPSQSGFQSARPRGRVSGQRSSELMVVSIRAAWGDPFFLVCQRAPSFNPRARVGRHDLGSGRWPRSRGFQSARPRGARPRTTLLTKGSLKFQSARPRGGRPISIVFSVVLVVSIRAPA